MPTWKTAKLKKLSQTLLSIKDEKEMLAFLRDVATFEELDSLSSRWQVAQMIDKGIPYRKIAEKTGLSTATITRVAHWINHGEGGYRTALNKAME
jgi:TrpR-related protein YerC/YecD